MKWTKIIEKGLVEKIPQVKIAKISQPIKAEGGYFFDLYIKLIDGKRGTCRGIFITSEFIEDGFSSEISDIFTGIVEDEITRVI